ncbi:HNH endonuclease signature motif containing protein [Corynebacterium sp. HS2168-gen11]|uniref:HNH endonuclease signature motif containing protein n=1 Tax=Corynebacterium sp. HS2168-gen11 TaxID=2974027 RepID=UPI00216B4A5B|nr:HNH endonuclease signature motif containing protein [Corynebacterium sp. HS2168-gen11]MCS4535625.1 HNH endonuclease [Corynebacterium sp. HS2168-gen11]
MSDLFATIASVNRSGAALIAAVQASTLTNEQLAESLDLPFARVSLIRALAKRLSPEQLRLARKHAYSIDRLQVVCQLLHRIKNPNVDAKGLVTKTLVDCADMTHTQLRSHIRELIESLNEGFVPPRRWYLRFSHRPDHDGMKYLIAKLPAAHANRLQTTLTPQATSLLTANHAGSHQEALAKALLARCLDDAAPISTLDTTENPDNPLDLRHRPCFLLPFGDTTLLETGEIVNSDGSVVKLSDVINTTLAPTGFAVTYFNDANGIPTPRHIFDIQRFADSHQRFLTIINHLVCQHPDCATPAVRCDMHHIKAHSQNGLTTLDNLAPLCHKHNLENDDDPRRHKNGRIKKDPLTGEISHIDYKHRVRRNTHPSQQHLPLKTMKHPHPVHEQHPPPGQ